MKTTPCKGCGKPIVFARSTDTGAVVPLDPRALVYVAHEDPDGDVHALRSATGMAEGGGEVRHMVSHFATCPKAADFSHRNKPGGAT